MADNFKFDIAIELPAGAEKELQRAAQQALKQVAAELDGRFADALSGSYWTWDNRYGGKSKRGLSGSTVGERAKAWNAASFNTPMQRSIVDSGELKQSGTFSLSKNRASWKWTADYAAAVHDGARIQPWGNKSAGAVTLPGRPWTDAVLIGGVGNYSGEKYEFTEELQRRIAKLLS